ncbi:MAG TPA: thioredoxin family protein, partial [Burkholderiaceae bacterium]
MSVRSAGWVLMMAVGALAACSKPVAPPPAAEQAEAAKPAHAEPAIDWVKGDPAAVDAAFARARQARQPLFLYWGAVWCPPCNEVKATVFKRRDFAERARFFIPVYIDGDSAGAQKLGTRFKVSAYPTMIL